MMAMGAYRESTSTRASSKARNNQFSSRSPLLLDKIAGKLRNWYELSSQNDSRGAEQSAGLVANLCAVLGEVSSADRTDVRAINVRSSRRRRGSGSARKCSISGAEAG